MAGTTFMENPARALADDAPPLARTRLLVSGVVQGVGFRPFVYVLAQRHQLAGQVGNSSSGVFIEVEGSPAALTAFLSELRASPPPLAHIESVTVEALPPRGDTLFEIVHSEAQPNARTLVSPDICICDDCLRELFDPHDRRFRYPFINCTNCGPRFSITHAVPYDRPLTTMAAFTMCPTCQAEYDDPGSRRFHAQPNACPECGPRVWLQYGAQQVDGDDALLLAQSLLAAGKIIAVKGVGGFHLACDATNDQAVSALRQRKGRVDKPFAVMARDLGAVRRFAVVSTGEAALLTGRERPVVLLCKSEGSALSERVAPGNAYVGVLLPYTPLHYLLLDETPLVMTSGNFSGEPICIDNQDALERLGALADAFLLHDRAIHVPCDDAVMRVFAGVELPVRRSRGYAPFPVKLPFELPPLLAVGAELKNTFCLTHGDHAFMSQHIGDMENLETLDALSKAVEHFKALFRTEPQAIIADSHPRYLSSRWAAAQAERAGIPLIQVQHHHAHIAAVMAEHGLDGREPVIGVCFDGTGYGTDGAIWGGEILLADYHHFRRAAHPGYVPLPGGDSAVKHPGRLALAYLHASGVPWDEGLPPVKATTTVQQQVIARQMQTGFNTNLTSSAGRLFDAVAALAGVRQTITYEAQAAMELEALVDPKIEAVYPFPLRESGAGAPLQFDCPPLIHSVAADVLAGTSQSIIAARFHNTMAEGILTAALRLRSETGCSRVALGGGVFQNIRLLELTVERLRAHAFEILWHRLVPPNDGGLALGQAVVGGCCLLNNDMRR